MLDQTPGPDKLVPIEDVAKQFTVSVPTIRAWQRQGLIPKDCYIHVGNTYRYHLNRIIERLLAAPKDGEVVADPSEPAQLELPFEASVAPNETDKDL